MFVQKFDALVTRHYSDIRFAEFETRIPTTMGHSFKNLDARFGKLHVMGGIIIAATVIPALQKLFVWLGQALSSHYPSASRSERRKVICRK